MWTKDSESKRHSLVAAAWESEVGMASRVVSATDARSAAISTVQLRALEGTTADHEGPPRGPTTSL